MTCVHSNSAECDYCERDRLRRDLATRDRELAEARAGWGDAQNMLFDVADQRDQARAALAEKERELAEFRVQSDRVAWQAVEDGRAIRAAQEEAKGLRAQLDKALDTLRRCDSIRCLLEGDDIDIALAARQQQPDGKKEDGNG